MLLGDIEEKNVLFLIFSDEAENARFTSVNHSSDELTLHYLNDFFSISRHALSLHRHIFTDNEAQLLESLMG